MIDMNKTVDMNVIMLEGVGLYIVLAIILFMVVALAVLAWSGIRQDEKMEMLRAELKQVETSNIVLHRENFRYRLKFGALDSGNEQ